MTAQRPTGSAVSSESVAGAQTIARALAILDVLAEADPDLGFSEIARSLGLHTSTTHRILRALVAAGYVTQNADERYRLGRHAFLLGRAAERGLGFDLVLPLLERASEKTGESVNLVVRDGPEGVVVLRVESKQRLRFAQPVGTRIPLHCTSTGKAMLAFAADPRAELAALGKLPRVTDATLTTHRVLIEEFDAIRRRGYSVNLAERVPGVHGVAAPVRLTDVAVSAAVAVQGPDIRMPESRIAELGQVVVALAAEVAAMVPSGYQL